MIFIYDKVKNIKSIIIIIMVLWLHENVYKYIKYY